MSKQSEVALSKSERKWLWLRAIIFPVLVLVPYILIRQKGCAYPESAPCVVRGQPSLLPQALIWLLTLGVLFVAYRQHHVELRARRAVFIRRQLRVSLWTVIATVLVYVLIRPHSQAESFLAFSQHPDRGYAQVAKPWLGLGIAPATLLYISILYLISPIYGWYAMFRSRKHIEGIKKEDLFQ